MELYFGGAEVPRWKELLQREGVGSVSASYLGLIKSRVGGNYSYPGNVFIDSGAYTFNKPGAEYDYEDAYETAAQYMEFVKANVDRANLISEFDARQLGLDVIKDMRSEFYDNLSPDKFMPIWHPDYGREELESLCSSYSVVGVCQADIHGDTAHVPLFNTMVSRYGTKLHGVGITSKKLLEAVKWSSASSTSWLTPSRFGDTFVWTGKKLMRYPKTYKDRRKSHRSLFIDNGFDYELIEADDTNELLRLSIWSWQHYIASISGVTTNTANNSTIKSESLSAAVAPMDISLRTEPITERPTVMLPVMGKIMPRQENEDSEEESRPVLIIRSESMRVCDNCFLKDKCPGFQPNSTCLYNIPIEIRTKDQLRALHDSLIEMQTHRVLFMKMAEDLGGGYADPNLSSEMDRLNRMIKARQDGDKNTFTMSMSVSEVPQRKETFMAKMLGTDAAEKLRQLEAPVDADEIMEAEIVG